MHLCYPLSRTVDLATGPAWEGFLVPVQGSYRPWGRCSGACGPPSVTPCSRPCPLDHRTHRHVGSHVHMTPEEDTDSATLVKVSLSRSLSLSLSVCVSSDRHPVSNTLLRVAEGSVDDQQDNVSLFVCFPSKGHLTFPEPDHKYA